MFEELDVVVLKASVDGSQIPAGAEGVIVHTHTVPRLAYLVEFCNDKGETLDTLSLLPEQIEHAAALKHAA